MNKSTRFWDRVADSSGEGLGATSQKTVALSLPFLQKSDIVLDFGCGPGNLSNAIANQVQQVDGIDISSGMIATAQARAAKLNLQNVHFAQLDLFDQRLKSSYYDAILAFNVLHYLDDLIAIANRARCLVKPGGLFISATACMGEGMHPLRPLMFIMTKFGIVPKMHFYKLKRLQGGISASGFQLIAIEKISALPEYFLVMKSNK